MIVLAFALSLVLLLITALHVYWGIGGIWPGRDAASCARAVVGFRGVHEMPAPFASFAVAACLGLATLWPMALEGVFATPFPKAGLAATALLIALVFLARGHCRLYTVVAPAGARTAVRPARCQLLFAALLGCRARLRLPCHHGVP
nr:DUF3995 domain-containing protein [Mesorhizobium sp.]